MYIDLQSSENIYAMTANIKKQNIHYVKTVD